MPLLLADSGSTKTDWILLNGSEIVTQFRTNGINPYFQTKDQISLEILNAVKPALSDHLHSIAEIAYYGAGCSTAEHCRLIEECLRLTLDVQQVSVSHDLLAAARALCNREWGIASILGTGSNSCLYDGTNILENVPSTGYLWSDYGGGSQIGKYFIREYFEGRLPAELRHEFEAAGYNREEILKQVYKVSVPGRYLATVSLFAGKHLHHPVVQGILEECFDSFFVHQVNKYDQSKRYKVHTVGSIGYFYKDIIARIAKKHGYEMGNVIKSPLEGLIRYHAETNT